MSAALLLIYILMFVAVIAFISGVFILWGIGWTLIAFSACLFGFIVLLSRGLVKNE